MESLKHVVLCLVISVLCRAAANGQEAQPQYPLPEKLVHHGDTSFYIRKATEFLRQAPGHPLAPRVMYELMMVAAVKDNGKLAKEMRQKLILDHIKGLHGLFLLRSFEKEDDYRKFKCASIRYSSVESFGFSPPAWPELKTVTKQEFDASLLFKLMGMLSEKFCSTKSGL